tara:strand:- start:627 stop:1394 length:768 start_codon:yes stop_codon:yes gene_type:complete
MDFTIAKYENLLKGISSTGLKIYTVKDWIKLSPEKGICIRHDVDRKPANSLKFAELEENYGIQSTYYFRSKKVSFDQNIIKNISFLGHEIGYHYEELSDCKGDYRKAISKFEKNLKNLRKFAPVQTISMHGAPLSKIDNRDIWKKFSFADYDIIGEAYLTIDYKNTYYFTDTGRSWLNDSVNLRDIQSDSLLPKKRIASTDELIDFIKSSNLSKIIITSHPERWSSHFFEYLKILVKDNLKIFIKNILIKMGILG